MSEVSVPAGNAKKSRWGAPGAAEPAAAGPSQTKVSQRVERGEYVKLTQLQFNVPKPRKRTQDLCPCECDPSSPCEDNDCLNRMMYMECSSATCPCATKCRNRRFQVRATCRARPAHPCPLATGAQPFLGPAVHTGPCAPAPRGLGAGVA